MAAMIYPTGELIVIDAGAEAEMCATELTRTLPVGGKLSAQKAIIATAHAGVTVGDIDRATRKVIEDGGSYDCDVHPCCHFVGLEVHDAGDHDAPLPAGAVLTVEPGISLPQRGTGVRIEDEILITAPARRSLPRISRDRRRRSRRAWRALEESSARP
jgi:Xaa-Pro aminopeptidase